MFQIFFAYPKSHAKRVHLYICFEGIIQSTTKKDITKKKQTLPVPEETKFEQKEEGKTLKPLRMRFFKKVSLLQCGRDLKLTKENMANWLCFSILLGYMLYTKRMTSFA